MYKTGKINIKERNRGRDSHGTESLMLLLVSVMMIIVTVTIIADSLLSL
jgi:hypothetical protein